MFVTWWYRLLQCVKFTFCPYTCTCRSQIFCANFLTIHFGICNTQEPFKETAADICMRWEPFESVVGETDNINGKFPIKTSILPNYPVHLNPGWFCSFYSKYYKVYVHLPLPIWNKVESTGTCILKKGSTGTCVLEKDSTGTCTWDLKFLSMGTCILETVWVYRYTCKCIVLEKVRVYRCR